MNGKSVTGKSVQTEGDINSVSIAMKITYGSFKYFTGGDLTGGGRGTPDVESLIAERVGDVNVMKSDHHGSATANNSFFLSKLKPENVIVTVGNGGVNKRYHLPNAETMARMVSFPFIETIFQTARGEGGRVPASETMKIKNTDGDVIVVAGQDRYWINNFEIKTNNIP